MSETKHGRFRYYSINPGPLHELGQWLNPYELFWRDRFTKLKTVLKEIDP